MKTSRQFAEAVARHLLSPFVPDRKALPFQYWLHMLGGPCGPELTQIEKFFCGTGIALDIGANLGLFTYRLSKSFRHVYAFEINPDLAAPILEYNPGNITLYSCGLSSAPRIAKLYVPVMRGSPLTGWASLNPRNLPAAQSFVEKDVEVKPLDGFGLTGVDFIKIDVEGHELEVIQGAAATIEQSRPVLLVEVKDQNLQAVNTWFKDRDFRQISLAHVFQLKRSENYLFVPAEKLDQLAINTLLPSAQTIPQ